MNAVLKYPGAKNRMALELIRRYDTEDVFIYVDLPIIIVPEQGYLGANLIFDFLNENNQTLHQNLVKKIANSFQPEGFLFFITINYRAQEVDNTISIYKINYSNLSPFVNGIIFYNLFGVLILARLALSLTSII